jgi:hypothetical protein
VGIFNRLFGDDAVNAELDRGTDVGDPRGQQSKRSERQENQTQAWGFPPIFSHLDTHPKDGFPDSPMAAFGSRYQLVQMLSLRDPDDVRWLQDNHPTPPWLRTSPIVWEAQRSALEPDAGTSPYILEAWHADAYRGVPHIGRGPGSTLVVPLANQNQLGIND